MVILETKRLFLRDWVPDDWKRFKPLATDLRVLRYIGRGEPSSDERIQAFVNGGMETARSRGWILWPVIHRADAELIGFCGFADGFPPKSRSAGVCGPNTGARGWQPRLLRP